mgnify:CR=1 FL=1
MAVGNRIYLKRELPDEETVKKFENIPAANIGDCINRNCAMASRIKLMSSPEKPMLGVALTVKSREGDNLMIHKALKMAGKGDVIVVSNEEGVNRALIGELMAATAEYNMAAGLVFDGPVRDIDNISKMKLPVYATGTTPGGPYKTGPGEINVPISCGGVAVEPGDIIVGDSDGIVVIPKKDAASIIDAVLEKHAADTAGLEKSKTGKAKREWVEAALEKAGCEIIDGTCNS